MQYNALDLMQLTEEAIWQLPDGKMTIQFQDGVLETTRRRTLISWYFWRLHAQYGGQAPSIAHHLGNKQLRKGFELKLGAKVFWDVYEAVPEPRDPELVWHMSKTMYEIINAIHNMTALRLSGYVTTVDLGDMVDLMDDPVIADLKDKVRKDEISFEEAYKEMIEELSKPKPNLRHNGNAKMARAGLLSPKQVVQLILARGYVFAVDGSVYPEPIREAYGDGFSTLHDSITESRSASRALYMNDDPLKKSEYFNRQMQLLTEVISRVEGDDCGSKLTIPWLVEKDDLFGLRGKYHVEDGQVKLFDHTDESYIGKVVYVRSITLCRNHDTSSVCKTCLGQISRVIPTWMNVGHFLTTDPLGAIAQLILSTKHVETSQGAMLFPLDGVASKWLRYDKQNRSMVVVKRQNAANAFVLRFNSAEAPGLNSLFQCKDPESLLPQRISCVTEIELYNADQDGNPKGDPVMFNTVIGGVGSALSSDVIKCLLAGWKDCGNGIIEVKLDNFKDKALFITPRRSENIMSFQKRISNFIFGTTDHDETMTGFSNVGQAVTALKRIFDEKIKINLAHAEIFVRACMTVNGPKKDYRLPRGGDPFIFMPSRTILTMRSVSAALAFQGQQKMLLRPSTYMVDNRPPHPLDAVL